MTETPVLKFVNVEDEDVGILMRQTDKTFSFYSDNKVVGKLTWDNGKFSFEGNMEESARVFFDLLIEGGVPSDDRI